MNCFGSFLARDRRYYDHHMGFREPAFMSCIIRVYTEKSGWQRSVARVLRTIQARTCSMSGNDELLEVSGIGIPRLVARAIWKSKKLKLEHIQYGPCSENLYGPDRRRFLPPVLAAAAAVPDMAAGFGYPIRGGYCHPMYPPTAPPHYYDQYPGNCNVM